MSLFSQLQRLYREDRFLLEDFHTEIVAQVLRNSSALTLKWLRDVGATVLETADSIEIRTQEEFSALPGHSTASRPDITIRISSAGKNELVFVESKLPSTQGDDQLLRYAEQAVVISANEGVQKAFIVFITRDYEAAELPDHLVQIPGPTLVVTRWFHFYRILKAHQSDDGLVRELKLFMEENRMSLGNQFRSTDVVALENFLSAKALMDETLNGEVSAELRKLFGGVWPVGKAPNELRDHHRYIVANPNWTDYELLVGYWLPHENPDDPVWIGVTFFIKPSSKVRQELIAAFHAWTIDAGVDWETDKLEAQKGWSGIYKGKNLNTFMASDDHVQAIKAYLLGLLKEIGSFKVSYPTLPWGLPALIAIEDDQ